MTPTTGPSDAPADRPAAPTRARSSPGRRWWRALLVLGLFLLLVAADAVYVEPDWIEVTRHQVELALPRPIKVAHLSDLHTIGLERRERRLLDELAAEAPDLIVITGDTLSEWGTYPQCEPLLARLKAPLGVFMVPGNWEVANPRRDFHAFFASCGVTWLRNESVEVVPGVWLVGLDDFAIGLPDLARAVKGVPAEATRILLFHSPGFFDEVASDGAGEYPLAFSGHTHGGQVRLPFLPPLHLPSGCGPYVEGWYERAGSRMYVSRGIGMSVVRLRFCCRPELAIHTLVPSARVVDASPPR